MSVRKKHAAYIDETNKICGDLRRYVENFNIYNFIVH